MKFLLVYNHLYLGGIETLIVRISNWLVANGHNVRIVLSLKKGELLNQLDKRIEVEELGFFKEISFLQRYFLNKYNRFDVFFSFSPSNLWMTYALFSKSKNPNKVIFNGVYHSKDFELYGRYYDRIVFNNFLPDENKVFMSSPVKESQEKYFNRKFQKSLIWPLPIDGKPFENIIRTPKKFKIVSIGRLTGFKTYNIYMLDIIEELLRKGYSTYYEIYGEGGLRKEIEEKSKELGIEEFVLCKGNIDYYRIPEVLKDAYVFVGMGTSLLESAYFRVPSITAISYSEKPITHGFVHDLPNHNCGQYDSDLKEIKVLDLLNTLFNMPKSDYERLCYDSYYRTKQQYSIDNLMGVFMEEITNLQKASVHYNVIHIPYILLTKDLITRHLKLLKKQIKKIKNKL